MGSMAYMYSARCKFVAYLESKPPRALSHRAMLRTVLIAAAALGCAAELAERQDIFTPSAR